MTGGRFWAIPSGVDFEGLDDDDDDDDDVIRKSGLDDPHGNDQVFELEPFECQCKKRVWLPNCQNIK